VASPVRSLRVWINAFIPGHVPGYTDELTTGLHAGKTVLYGLGGGKEAYMTDQRMFSSALDASSQMHSEALVDFLASPAKLAEWHACDFSAPLAGEDGAAERQPADTSRMHVTMATQRTLSSHRDVARAVGVLPRRLDASAEEIYLYFSAAATPVCEHMAAHFGDITYEGVAIFDPPRSALAFHGEVHRFPAFEMYASVNEAAPIAVFRLSPPRGSQTLHRPGAGRRPIKAAATLS
jgi:hypothetical protein